MENGAGEVQTTVVEGTADEIEAQVAAIEAGGGTLVSVRLSPASDGPSALAEVAHT